MDVIVAADYNTLEVRIFAHYSGSKSIQGVFHKNLDFYSKVAIDVLGLTQYSANKKDDNFLKNKNPEARQQTKIFALMVPYNADGYAIAASMGYYTTIKSGKNKGKQRVDVDRGNDLKGSYLNRYPEIRNYMARCKYEALTKGYVKNMFGRIRRLARAKEIHNQYDIDSLLDIRWARQHGLMHIRKELKGLLNIACNFKIQSTAADITNRAMIELTQHTNENNILADVRLQVHDEVICTCDDSIQDVVAKWLKYYMENNIYAKQLSVPMIATPVIAHNLGDAK